MFVRQEAFDIKVLNDFSESSKSYKSRNRRFRNEAERAVAWNLQVFTYDHKGRMIRKTISRGDAEPQSIGYVWDGWNIVREELRTPHSQLRTTHNLWGLDLDGTMQGAGGVGGLLAVVPEDGAYIPTYDANGNISEYLSASDGFLAAHYDYSPFGETLVASGPLAASFTHRFSTKPWCFYTRFIEYIYRNFRADVGRWVSRDLLSEFDNLYLFVYNSTFQFIDPDGEQAIAVGLYGKNTKEGAFAGWAKRFSPEHNYEVEFGVDFVNALIEASKSSDSCCIGKLAHFYHGYGYRDHSGMYFYNNHSYPNELIISENTTFGNGLLGYTTNQRNRDAGSATLSDVESAIKNKKIVFCNDCSIIFTGCRIGQTALPAALARTTGCKVTAAMAGSSPDEPIGKDGKSHASGIWNSFPGYFEEKSEPDTGWVEFAPDGSRTSLGKTIEVW